MKIKPLSSFFLSLGGFFLLAIGIYFIFLRPPLLPEDLRYMNITLIAVQNNISNLSIWLQKVFWVMGCFILTTGLFTMYVAQTSFRIRTRGAFIIISIAGITSIGSITIVNFILQSDFKWALLAFTIPWLLALIFYLLHK